MSRSLVLRKASWLPILAAALGLTACGSGTTAAGAAPAANGAGVSTTSEPAPEVAVLMMGGHAAFDASANYLEKAAAPYLAEEIEATGRTVATFGFVDDADGPNGFPALKARLAAIRDDWIRDRPNPTRVVLVAHSHGGPWAHAATRDVPDCPIHCFVDLDTSSYAWELVHSSDAALGGNPVDQYTIPVTVNPPLYPTVLSEPGDRYDLEDVIFPSVREALEVVTGALVPDVDDPTQFHRYDERWNARVDGTTGGLFHLYSGTPHSEPAIPPTFGGTTLGHVKNWIVERLAAP